MKPDCGHATINKRYDINLDLIYWECVDCPRRFIVDPDQKIEVDEHGNVRPAILSMPMREK